MSFALTINRWTIVSVTVLLSNEVFASGKTRSDERDGFAIFVMLFIVFAVVTSMYQAVRQVLHQQQQRPTESKLKADSIPMDL
jgi:K+-transporting ATPase A subunit